MMDPNIILTNIHLNGYFQQMNLTVYVMPLSSHRNKRVNSDKQLPSTSFRFHCPGTPLEPGYICGFATVLSLYLIYFKLGHLLQAVTILFMYG